MNEQLTKFREATSVQDLPPEFRQVLTLARSVLGDNLIAAYAYGSAVLGGLHPHSDVDILLIVAASTAGEARRQLTASLLEMSGTPGNPSGKRPLEVTVVVLGDVVPWRYPPMRDFQFGEWLRDALSSWQIASAAPDPDLTILLHSVLVRNIVLYGPPPQQLLDPALAKDIARSMLDSLPGLISGLAGDERNVILTLARMWETLASGQILPKDVAAQRVAQRLPPQFRAILHLAAAEYRGERRVDWSRHRRQTEAFVACLETVIRQHSSDTKVSPQR